MWARSLPRTLPRTLPRLLPRLLPRTLPLTPAPFSQLKPLHRYAPLHPATACRWRCGNRR